jgi:hypothetical protein
VYSLKVWLHFVQRKNCVEDSSPPRVCTCHTYARLFPHWGHSTLRVGSVLIFCSSLPIIVTRCLMSCLITLVTLGLIFLLDIGFLYPHLEQTSITVVPSLVSTFSGFKMEAHSGQNSITKPHILYLIQQLPSGEYPN